MMRRNLLRVWVVCWLVLVWILLWGTFSAANILSGLFVALVIICCCRCPRCPSKAGCIRCHCCD